MFDRRMRFLIVRFRITRGEKIKSYGIAASESPLAF
jgi:hypothetical protein